MFPGQSPWASASLQLIYIAVNGTFSCFRWVQVFTLRSGKIVEFEEPADVSALVEEFRRGEART